MPNSADINPGAETHSMRRAAREIKIRIAWQFVKRRAGDVNCERSPSRCVKGSGLPARKFI